MKTEVERLSETLVTNCQSTWRHSTQDCNLQEF